MKKYIVTIILLIVLLIGLLVFQATSGLFDSESPESKILDILDEQGVNILKINYVYNMDGIKLMYNLMNDLGEESIDMFLCDLPYTYKGKQRVTANKWDTPIDIDDFFKLSKILLKPNGVIALTATNPFSSYLVNKGIDMFKYE